MCSEVNLELTLMLYSLTIVRHSDLPCINFSDFPRHYQLLLFYHELKSLCARILPNIIVTTNFTEISAHNNNIFTILLYENINILFLTFT